MKKEWYIQRGTNTWTEDEGFGSSDFYDSVRDHDFKNSTHVIEYPAYHELLEKYAAIEARLAKVHCASYEEHEARCEKAEGSK